MMEDNRNVLTPLEDGSGRASPVYGVSEQPWLGEDRPVSPASGRSITGRLIPAQGVPEQLLQDTTGRVSSRRTVVGSRRVSPAASLADSLQSVGMTEELRFQLEMKRLELEAEERREARRLELETEERRLAAEERRLAAEERREARRLEIEAASEVRRLKLEARRLEVEKEEAQKNRDFELERSRIGANSTHKGGGEGEENSVERQIVRRLQLIPDFDEQKVAEWLRRFEKKKAEFGWPEKRWVGLVANKLKGRALEAYDNMSVKDFDVYEDFKANIIECLRTAGRSLSSKVPRWEEKTR